MADSFKTISQRSEGIYKEKGSKFLSFAIPVKTTEEVKEQVAAFRREFYDARHVCYAYTLGADRENFRSNDDGEPSGTAGRPILGQINSFEITDVMIVVVRYFGGILLGTGGLITAYKAAAADAIQNAEIVERAVEVQFTFRFEYVYMNEVMRWIKETGANIVRQDFDSNCSMQVSVSKSMAHFLEEKLKKITSLEFIL